MNKKDNKLVREIYCSQYMRLRCPHCKEELFSGHIGGITLYKLDKCRKCNKPIDMSDWIKEESND